MQWVGHPKETSLLAGSLWEDAERVLSLHLLSYFVVSQSTVMAQDMELAHLFKNSYFCFLLWELSMSFYICSIDTESA